MGFTVGSPVRGHRGGSMTVERYTCAMVWWPMRCRPEDAYRAGEDRDTLIAAPGLAARLRLGW